MSKGTQRLDLPLHRIVPEYRSRNALVRWLFHERLTTALEHVKALKPEALIDIGCGAGHFMSLLNREKIKVPMMWGIDLNPNVRDLVLPNCTFAQLDLLHTEFPDHTFDVAVCLDTLEHVEALRDALTEIRRIIRPCGYLITSEPVESAFYKSLRFLFKGTTSGATGPGAGAHYYNAREIDTVIAKSGFVRLRTRKLPLPAPLDLFHVNLYQRVQDG
jgi:ubiquinone/menaquinone biosynthesis C-methylase UbiE